MYITKEEIRRRQEYLRRIMAGMETDALCVGASAQIDTRGIFRYLINYYLPVFEEYLVIPRLGPAVLFVHDSCGMDYARNFGVVDEVRVMPEREYAADPAKSVVSFLRDIGCKTVGTVWGRGISSSFCLSFRNHLGGIKTKDFAAILDRMRMIKSPAEIAIMKEAVRFNEKVLEVYLKEIAIGRREQDTLGEASLFALQNGAEDLYWMNFSCKIPAMGYHAASRERASRWQRGDYHYVVLEHSYRGGYFSEIIQMVSLRGKPKKEYLDAYRAVSAAQREAGCAIKPGVQVSRLSDIARSVLAAYGYCRPEAPFPSIGHSQGLDAWEPPRISGDENITIKPGMRFNLHPSVTLPDGAKITSCVSYLSTENGSELLSTPSGEIIVV